MTYEFAMHKVPVEAKLTATFGHPGDGGYSEYYRFEGERFIVSNGPYDAVQPFTWTVERELISAAFVSRVPPQEAGLEGAVRRFDQACSGHTSI